MSDHAEARRAAREAGGLLRHALPDARRGEREHVRRAEKVADRLYRRFRVYPKGWKQKHLYWVRDELLGASAASTRYHYYRTLVRLAHVLERPQIVPGGAWTAPDGREKAGPEHGGRPMRLPPPANRGKHELGRAEQAAVAAVEALLHQAHQDGDEAAQRRAEAALAELTGGSPDEG